MKIDLFPREISLQFLDINTRPIDPGDFVICGTKLKTVKTELRFGKVLSFRYITDEQLKASYNYNDWQRGVPAFISKHWRIFRATNALLKDNPYRFKFAEVKLYHLPDTPKGAFRVPIVSPETQLMVVQRDSIFNKKVLEYFDALDKKS